MVDLTGIFRHSPWAVGEMFGKAAVFPCFFFLPFLSFHFSYRDFVAVLDASIKMIERVSE